MLARYLCRRILELIPQKGSRPTSSGYAPPDPNPCLGSVLSQITNKTVPTGFKVYRDISLTTKCNPPGPNRRPMSRVLGGTYGGGRCFMGEVPLCGTFGGTARALPSPKKWGQKGGASLFPKNEGKRGSCPLSPVPTHTPFARHFSNCSSAISYLPWLV